jgi:hypothetical protein
MTTFWRPLLGGQMPPRGHATYKFLGRGVYEMWCRCDLCFRSGPSTEYTFLERDESSGELCADCAANTVTIEELRSDGWRNR